MPRRDVTDHLRARLCRAATGVPRVFLEAIYQHLRDRAYEDVGSATDFAIAQDGLIHIASPSLVERWGL